MCIRDRSGGKGQYGHVKIIVEPNESGKGYEFINKIVGGAIPKEYIEPVNQGIPVSYTHLDVYKRQS